MIAIKTTRLTKIYRRQHLGKVSRSLGVEDLDLSVMKGEVFGLLGLNGAGKTTTIKLLLGLLRPTQGEVALNGVILPDTRVLATVGYLPEVPYFYRYLTAAEILSLYADLSGLDRVRERVGSMLETVGLTSVRDKRLLEFSKGMLQRIGLAQSLLHDPELLIYDEPVSGLDPLAVQEMRTLILKLKEKGKTVFLSSHLISEVEKMCDRVGILVKGRLVRVLEQKEWSGRTGELERIFVADAAESSEMGRIKL
jgi:ABC-2 type transport system ATP-binding protein